MATTATTWGSRIGFILAGAGSAIGLGSIWKFPFWAGINGGSGFIIPYIIFTFTIGITLLIAELVVGRAGRGSALHALKHLGGPVFSVMGGIAVLTSFVILSYYSVVGGWCVKYLFDSLCGELVTNDPKVLQATFGALVGDGLTNSLWHFSFLTLTCGVVALGVVTTVALYYVTGLPMTTMVGVMSGAVTNTPGLGAAQQAFSDLHAGADAPDIATGYALAYPLGVIGAILTLLALRYLLRIDVRQEEEAAGLGTDVLKDLTTRRISVEICNPAVEGKSISGIRRLALRDFVVSRICRPGEAPELADAATTLRCGDRILLVAAPKDAEALVALLGREVDAGPMMQDRKMISRRILITKPELNGKTLAELRIRSTSGVTITRINRSGIDLVAAGNLQLQLGDRVTVVGPELSVAHAERLFGNSLKRLNHPNLIPIFIGIALGVVLGSISFWIPGVPQPVKLGLAGGPLIVAILIGRYGPHYRLITYTTMSANLMLREVGISLFLAGVGLGAGEDFVPTLVAGGYVWIAYGAVITIVPLLLAGLFGRFYYKLNYYTLIGVLSGASTNPPALAYSTEQTTSDAPSVGYATVYPLSMFLRVLAAQLLILIFG